MNEHLSKQFDIELENIRTRILQMGGLVERQLREAVDAFTRGDLVAMERVVKTDKEVNAFQLAIDEDCIRVIARRQPTARDLRLVMAVSRIVTDLERIGDKARKIARRSRKLYESDRAHIPRLADVAQCGEMAQAMLHTALDALARMDGEASRQVLAEGSVIDARFDGIVRQLITYMMEDPRTISDALEIMAIGKALERAGDHVCNIAENVVFVVSGEDIRHAPNKGGGAVQ